MSDLQDFKLRWDALEQHLDTLIGQASGFHRSNVVSHVLKQLKSFAHSHFKFFYEGFLAEQLPNIERWGYLSAPQNVAFPPQYALTVVLDRLSTDIQVLERIIGQRQANDLNSEVKTLKKADVLADKALNPARGANLIPANSTAITYFEKVAAIRVMPYANVALIGIPFTCTALPLDFLAIPHEVGHYVFWHSKDASQKQIHKIVEEKFKGEHRWLQNWIEEIFADVYGAVVSGAMGAVGLQHGENETSKYQFIEDDADHPTSLVRPAIYHQILGAGDTSHPQPGKANQDWESIVEERGFKELSFLVMEPEPGQIEPVDLDDVRAELGKAVNTLLTLPPLSGMFADGRQPVSWPVNLSDTKPLDGADSLISDYENAIANFPTNQLIARDALLVEDENIWNAWVQANNFTVDATAGAQNIVNRLDEIQGQAVAGQITVDGWRNVLKADGWTSEGPHSTDRP